MVKTLEAMYFFLRGVPFIYQGQGLGMTQEYPAVNAAAQQEDPDSILNFYKNMIGFRQKGVYRDCLIYGDIEPLDSSKNVIAY